MNVNLFDIKDLINFYFTSARAMEATLEVSLKDSLKRVFGYDKFRGKQEDIIHHILDKHNTFVIMPTGAGRSLCYQLPAIVQGGTAIVISPLIALMKNQVDQMNAVGINARFLNSTLTKAENTRVKKETISGDVKLLYVAPESLTKEENIEFLKQATISFVAIDASISQRHGVKKGEFDVSILPGDDAIRIHHRRRSLTTIIKEVRKPHQSDIRGSSAQYHGASVISHKCECKYTSRRRHRRKTQIPQNTSVDRQRRRR